MKSVFFIAVHMVLWFRFVTKTVLVTHANVLFIAEQCLHSIRAFSVSYSTPVTVNRLGMHNRLGGNTTRQITQTG